MSWFGGAQTSITSQMKNHDSRNSRSVLPTITLVSSDAQISACFDAIAELRPHLVRAQFVSQVRRLEVATGYRLAYLKLDEIRCVAGYRVSEWLAGGKYLEVEDLVCVGNARSRGYGSLMFEWLCDTARDNNCDHVRLVSRLHRIDAHRFYERKGMSREAYYYSLDL